MSHSALLSGVVQSPLTAPAQKGRPGPGSVSSFFDANPTGHGSPHMPRAINNRVSPFPMDGAGQGSPMGSMHGIAEPKSRSLFGVEARQNGTFVDGFGAPSSPGASAMGRASYFAGQGQSGSPGSSKVNVTGGFAGAPGKGLFGAGPGPGSVWPEAGGSYAGGPLQANGSALPSPRPMAASTTDLLGGDRSRLPQPPRQNQQSQPYSAQPQPQNRLLQSLQPQQQQAFGSQQINTPHLETPYSSFGTARRSSDVLPASISSHASAKRSLLFGTPLDPLERARLDAGTVAHGSGGISSHSPLTSGSVAHSPFQSNNVMNEGPVGTEANPMMEEQRDRVTPLLPPPNKFTNPSSFKEKPIQHVIKIEDFDKVAEKLAVVEKAGWYEGHISMRMLDELQRLENEENDADLQQYLVAANAAAEFRASLDAHDGEHHHHGGEAGALGGGAVGRRALVGAKPDLLRNKEEQLAVLNAAVAAAKAGGSSQGDVSGVGLSPKAPASEASNNEAAEQGGSDGEQGERSDTTQNVTNPQTRGTDSAPSKSGRESPSKDSTTTPTRASRTSLKTKPPAKSFFARLFGCGG
ncbi:uncharacterized protein EV422DRAFT_535562 [Fimicolochytrium jonesii]|uniref:uncharacterized protein n=1 Tax=Fimicolochytrium jonesii TaxID=1396493 RepID=UPI0022FE104C|nr:uncharacterized protein EV422DRAFT_535562 [Fimicolochytrium jonesii]KAI8819213.1 hypothetical protein EV422DRAFT_535562 [Fimicolochytrium jonesii]